MILGAYPVMSHVVWVADMLKRLIKMVRPGALPSAALRAPSLSFKIEVLPALFHLTQGLLKGPPQTLSGGDGGQGRPRPRLSPPRSSYLSQGSQRLHPTLFAPVSLDCYLTSPCLANLRPVYPEQDLFALLQDNAALLAYLDVNIRRKSFGRDTEFFAMSFQSPTDLNFGFKLLANCRNVYVGKDGSGQDPLGTFLTMLVTIQSLTPLVGIRLTFVLGDRSVYRDPTACSLRRLLVLP